jgi:hypothetical protein
MLGAAAVGRKALPVSGVAIARKARSALGKARELQWAVNRMNSMQCELMNSEWAAPQILYYNETLVALELSEFWRQFRRACRWDGDRESPALPERGSPVAALPTEGGAA